MKVLLLQEMLNKGEHVEPELVVLLMVNIHGDDLEDLFPVVNDGGLGLTHKQVKDEALG